MSASAWRARMVLLMATLCIGTTAFAAAELVVVGPMREQRAREVQLNADRDVMRRRRIEAEAEARMLGSKTTAAGTAHIWTASGVETFTTDIQGIVRDYLARSGATSVVTQASEENVGAAKAVTLLVRARIAEGGLSTFLNTIEHNTPSLLVRSFDAALLPGPTDSPLEFSAVIVAFYADEI